MVTEVAPKSEKMSYGTRLTLSAVLGSLLREMPSKLSPPVDGITEGLMPDLNDPLIYHKIRTIISPLPLTGEPQRVTIGKTTIDGIPINKPVDLMIIGMNDEQVKILENNAENLNLLHETQKKLQHKRPGLLDSIDKVYSTNITHEYRRPGNVFRMLSELPQEAAFIVGDALGNIEGPYGSSLGSTMVGEDAGNFHSVIVGGNEMGYLPIPFVKIEDSAKKYYGDFPENMGEVGELLRQGYIPIHPFNQKQFLDMEKISDAVFVNCYVLMSKRALVPVGYDFQIKTSLGLRILAGVRDIRFTQAQNGIENTRVLSQLAEKEQLPENCFIIGDKFAGQVDGDNHTTYIVRNKWNEPISNRNSKIPQNSIPITAASLIAKNVLSPVPLLQDFAEAGGNPVELTRDIIKMLIETQLDLIDKGYVAEMHGQNTVFLIDKHTKKLTGLMLRDHEGAKVDTEKMKEVGIQYYSVFNEAEDATSPLPLRKVQGETERKTNVDLYKKLVTGYLHRFVMTGIITPLILTANNRFPTPEMEIDVLAKYAKEIYMNWWKNKNKSFKEYTDVITPGYRASSGTLSALGVRTYPGSRSTESNPLIPTYQEMEEFLSK